MHVLLADTWHFHRKNFPALFETLARRQIPYTVESTRRRWWKAHGNYRRLSRPLQTHLSAIEHENLGQASIFGINLWHIAKAEFLCLMLPRPHWLEGGGANLPEPVLAKACANQENRADLLLCLAAARNWLIFWNDWFENHREVTHALVFSGAYIYTHALMAVARQKGIRTYCLEHFFTGNEFYFEERESPLPNASFLAKTRPFPSAPPSDTLDRLRAEMHRRVFGKRNKNVRATPRSLARHWKDQHPVVLIVGQVLNDFSLLETPLDELSSIAIYRDLILRLLKKTEVNIIFKTHPWERKRANLNAPITLNYLRELTDSLPEATRSRITLVEKEAITSLFPIVDHVVGLCSQGLLEACHAGFKPAQLGKAFFGGKGFTHDPITIDEYVSHMASGLRGTLTIDEYRAYEDFMQFALLDHLISNNAHGAEVIYARLANLPPPRYRQPPEVKTRSSQWLAIAHEVIENPVPWMRDAYRWLTKRA